MNAAEISAIVVAGVGVLGALAAWLKASAAHKVATAAAKMAAAAVYPPP